MGKLKASALLPVKKCTEYADLGFMDATYEVILPPDYLHLLNCMCIYKVLKPYRCYTPASGARAAATRLTADLFSLVTDNFWNRATYKKPYYYIHNVNKYLTNPTNPYEADSSDDGSYRTDVSGFTQVVDKEDNPMSDHWGNPIVEANNKVPTTINLRDVGQVSNIERAAGVRYGNVSEVRMEIRYGTDDLSVFLLEKVLIDYIKTPQHFLLTQEQLDRVEDTSLMLEFPDYVCQEIVNELVHIIMENISDQRLQTHPLVSLSIANPAQQLASQPAVSTA